MKRFVTTLLFACYAPSAQAQREIRLLADEMLRLVKNIEGNPFEHTCRAFGF